MKNIQPSSKGVITKWNDDKGFGFIAPESGGREVFFHISSFKNRGARPSLGLKVTFEPQSDTQGRSRAGKVQPLRPKRDKNNAGHAVNAFFTSALFLIIVAALVGLGFMPKLILWLYLGTSLLTYIMYAWDKSAARHDRRRTPEATLHWFALLGGWPGALFAQQHLRHKSKKQPFRVFFWLTVALNICALCYLLTPHGGWLLRDINQLFGGFA
ncbi:cold shock and DUF1294 domain-containing protein [Gilvimarinus japonicus]|jgi:uncharacterized membrane protein YsdA (DUF1294 family)/cold shock CspA family protein|uniref:Cold shock and DUF1294 domain-containing protein n=1 Tax=Gilvimarinus japonicus TaxID=1796469 RepID=A0ABV7HJI5_9GAMM